MEPFFVVVCVGIFLLVVLLSMGKKSSRSSRSGGKATSTFRKIADRFNTLEQVTQGLQKAGLEASQLIVAVDFTKSNLTQGKKTFGGKSLHAIGATPNPYERVIGLIGRTLSAFDDDNLIPAFGFGDSQSKGKSCFPFDFYYEPMKGFEAVLARYREISKSVVLSGPTNFAPVIHKAIEIVKETGEYTILLLLCDGQVTSQSATEAAIVEASKYPLAICIIGVGDGPWDEMEHYDDELPQRKVDNLQFVDSSKYLKYTGDQKLPEHKEAAFAVAALQELPDHYQQCKKLKML